MVEEENESDELSSQNEGCPKMTSMERAISKKKKKESVKTQDEAGGNLQSGYTSIESGKKKINEKSLEAAAMSEESGKISDGEKEKKGQKKRKNLLLKDNAEDKEEDVNSEDFPREMYPAAEGENFETTEGNRQQEVIGTNPAEEENPKSIDEMVNRLRKKKKERLLKEAAKANKPGVCYLSRIPPHMDHVKLRQILSQYGEIQRIYLVPEDPTARVNRKRAGGFRGQQFSEGWVEFTNKSVAKTVANMLNGEQIAYKRAVREQKLALEISAAKKERDSYLNKVDQSRALNSIEERLRKKQKIQQESGGQLSVTEQAPKVTRVNSHR